MTSEPSKNPAAGRKIILSEYFNDTPLDKLRLRRVLFNMEIAQAIYDMRHLKGLTQAQLVAVGYEFSNPELLWFK